MVARVSIYDVPVGRADEAATSFSSALEAISASRGFEEAYLLLSRDEGRAVVLTTWRDHDSMTASRITATRLRGDAVRAVDGDVVMVDEYEIAVHVTGRSAELERAT